MGEIICHNEFTIVGRVSEDIKMINDNSFRALIMCPNDDNYNDLANMVYVDFDYRDINLFKRMINQGIAVTGHIKYDNGPILVCDMYKFIN